MSEPLTPLCELAKRYETDKGGEHLRYAGGDSDTCHNYTRVYHDLFKHRRDTVTNVLEIGINAGSSLLMWRDYFPNAHITGLDIDRECIEKVPVHPRLSALFADQNNHKSLMDAIHKIDNWTFDLIVDDGSHERDHQIVSMKALLPFLRSDGLYVIEDLGTGEYDSLFTLLDAIPEGYHGTAIKITGGLGPKVQPHEWLLVINPVSPNAVDVLILLEAK